jgi:hypothetical protein
VIPQVGAQISAITAAVVPSTSEINALAPSSKIKRSFIAIEAPVINEKRQDIATEAAIIPVLGSIFTENISTIISAALILGTAALLSFTDPLIRSLPALILAVEAVLNIVLGTVTVLLDGLLDTFALAPAGAL